MGFTHYWSRSKKVPAYKFCRAATDCWRITQWVEENCGVKLVLDFDELDKPPKFERDEIWFNGPSKPSEGEGGETFVVPFYDPAGGGFCKTFRNKYDLMVCCALIILNHHLGKQFRVSSDGENNEENWPKAREVCQQLLGYGATFWLPPHGIAIRCAYGLVPKLVKSLNSGRHGRIMEEYQFPSTRLVLQRIGGVPRDRRWKVVDYYDRTILFQASNLTTVRWWATVEALKQTLPEHVMTSNVIGVVEGAKRTPLEWSGLWFISDEIEEYDAEVAREYKYRLPKRITNLV